MSKETIYAGGTGSGKMYRACIDIVAILQANKSVTLLSFSPNSTKDYIKKVFGIDIKIEPIQDEPNHYILTL